VVVSLQLPPGATALVPLEASGISGGGFSVPQVATDWVCLTTGTGTGTDVSSVSCSLASLQGRTTKPLVLQVHLPATFEATGDRTIQVTIGATGWSGTTTTIPLLVSPSPAHVDIVGDPVAPALTAGTFGTLALDLRNVGGSPVTAASEVVLEVRLPPGVTVGGRSGDTGWSCTSQGGSLTSPQLRCTLQDAPAGSAVPLDVDLLLEGYPAEMPGASVEITLTGPDYQAAWASPLVLQAAVLEIGDTDPVFVIDDPLPLGLSLSVTNAGNATATDVALTFVSPAVLFLPATELFPVTATGCEEWTSNVSLPGRAECLLGDLAPGEIKDVVAPAAVLARTAPLTLSLTGGGLPAPVVFERALVNL
jgi:hypothetical protein